MTGSESCEISIITPSYNQLDWLDLAVASVADQQGVQLEHIVRDAGTPGIEAHFAARTARKTLKLFVEPDNGMYEAINRGLQCAQGGVCAYLNCDEQYLPGSLRKVRAYFDTHPEVDVLFGDIVLLDRGGHPLSYRRIVRPTLKHIRAAHLNTASCATFFRKRLLDRGFFFNPQWRMIGDMVWVDTLLRANVRMGTLHEPLAAFTFTGNNMGATQACIAETVRWRGADRVGLREVTAVLVHRARKAFVGAYQKRQVEVEVYTRDSPNQRKHFQDSVGFRWKAPALSRM